MCGVDEAAWNLRGRLEKSMAVQCPSVVLQLLGDASTFEEVLRVSSAQESQSCSNSGAVTRVLYPLSSVSTMPLMTCRGFWR